ncbi:restriction endonuclease subunit S [Vibrio vulnificus]|uniref:restriction endonuclease subunit S n=1 Tax=Vibrio vulnificus TaxID=672 RepID=UPI000CD29A87|nr:restriction endonuclease subunit S [Vibrio vulnificus]POB89922.1 hypothetical protein CRN40_02305 [Vibrio vulnificus]
MSELPKGWFNSELCDVAEVVSGNAFKSKDFVENGIPVVKISNVQSGEYIEKNQEYLPESFNNKDNSRFIVTYNDLLIALTRPIVSNKLKVCTYPNKSQVGLLNQRVARLDVNEGFSKRFLHYYLSSKEFRESVQASMSETLQPNLSPKSLSKINIACPPLAEQKRIVEKLDEVLAQVDTIKARLDGIPAILKRFRQSVLASAVSGKLTSQDVSTQSSLVGDPWSHEVKAPSHWNLYEFKQAVKITGGSQPPKSEFKAEYEEGLVRLIQIRDYKSDKFLVYIPLDKAKRFCTEKDIMIGRYGPPIFQILRGISGAYNVALMKAEPAIDDLDLEYLYRFLQNPKLFHYIDAGSDRTAGQAGVNKKFLESYPLFVPPLEEQKEIVRLVDQYFAFADTIEAQVKKAQARVDNLTQSILAKAFRGELVPQDPNDEPADKLLERIAQARKEAEALTKAAKKAQSTKSTTKKKVAKSA